MDTDVLTDMILKNINDLTEADLLHTKKNTRSTDSRKTKIKRAAGQMATYDGRRQNDPLYHKMIHYRDLYYKYRDLLKKKYRAKNLKQARE
jgi:hypothetical protein